MTARSRQTMVLVTLFVSMLIGGAILSTLSHYPLSASAFCLSRYYRLAPVEDSVSHRFTPYQGRWKQIEIYYRNDGNSHNQHNQTLLDSGDVAEQLNSSDGRFNDDNADCHFVICNGCVGNNGQIQSTRNWQSQWPVSRGSPNHTEPIKEDTRTIYICIATNSKGAAPTDSQIKRTEALVEELCRRFDIRSEAILYPAS